MKILGSIGRMTTGVILMFTGVLLMFVFVTLPVITEIMSGNVFANLIIGAILLVIGFGIFTNPTITPKRQKRETLSKI